jgi:hypothetical protein
MRSLGAFCGVLAVVFTCPPPGPELSTTPAVKSGGTKCEGTQHKVTVTAGEVTDKISIIGILGYPIGTSHRALGTWSTKGPTLYITHLDGKKLDRKIAYPGHYIESSCRDSAHFPREDGGKFEGVVYEVGYFVGYPKDLLPDGVSIKMIPPSSLFRFVPTLTCLREFKNGVDSLEDGPSEGFPPGP